jgi:anti-sigma-K factor RskA
MNCEEVEELAGAYALGALPGDERAAVAAHLESCNKHPEMAELQAAAASLALAAPEIDPAPALRSRLMEAIRAEPTPSRVPLSAPSRRSFGETIRGWFSNPWLGYGLAGALSVLIVGLVAWNVSLRGDATTITTINGNASGRVFYIPGEKLAVMDAHDLTPLPADKVYEIWAMTGDAATPLGLLDVTPYGDATVLVPVDASGVDQLAVTAEAAPGVSQPTSAPVFTARF